MRIGVSRCSSSRRWIQPGCASPEAPSGARRARGGGRHRIDSTEGPRRSGRDHRALSRRAAAREATSAAGYHPGAMADPTESNPEDPTPGRPADARRSTPGDDAAQQMRRLATGRPQRDPAPDDQPVGHRDPTGSATQQAHRRPARRARAQHRRRAGLLRRRRRTDRRQAGPRGLRRRAHAPPMPIRRRRPPATTTSTGVARRPDDGGGHHGGAHHRAARDVPRRRSAGDELPHHRQRQQRVHRPRLAVRRRGRGAREPRQPQRHDHGAAPRPDDQGRRGAVVPARPVRRRSPVGPTGGSTRRTRRASTT